MIRHCIVMIPCPKGGRWEFQVGAESTFDAARKAIRAHESRQPRLADDVVVEVIVDGAGSALWNSQEINAQKPRYKLHVGAVRSTA